MKKQKLSKAEYWQIPTPIGRSRRVHYATLGPSEEFMEVEILCQDEKEMLDWGYDPHFRVGSNKKTVPCRNCLRLLRLPPKALFDVQLWNERAFAYFDQMLESQRIQGFNSEGEQENSLQNGNTKVFPYDKLIGEFEDSNPP